MANLVMAFGPKERFFVQSATAWKDNDLPVRLQKYFENPTTDAVSHVYNMALGSNGSFFIAYRKKNSLQSRSRAELPANLSEWVFSEERDVPNMYVTLGPGNKSYWASDGKSYICSNLPSVLDAEIEKLRKPEGGFRAAYNQPNSTFPAPRLLPQNREANTGSRSSGLLGALVTGVVKGTISGLTGTQPSYGNQFSFGGGSGFDQVDYSGANMAFQAGLQQNFGGNLIG